MITIAKRILNVKKDTLSPFIVQDPYNPNIIEGFICRQADHRYGALVITAVNGILIGPQVIYGTPKIKYPFVFNEVTGERKYNWPSNIKQIKAYDKLDGTNILIYKYYDIHGKPFITFKTRLTPILQESRFGNFKALWDDVLKRYPALRAPQIVLDTPFTMSLELYGYRNPHMVAYSVPIDTKLLFLVNQEALGEILPPDLGEVAKSIPTNTCIATAADREGVTALYEHLREQAHATNKGATEEGMLQAEGHVLYVLSKNETYVWQMYKAKPDEVEDIAWADTSVPKHSIRATCWNAFESHNELTLELLYKLLEEEYSKSQIGNSETRIKNIIEDVNNTKRFFDEVMARYDECSCKEKGKAPVMRYLSSFFKKSEMKTVYTALVRFGVFE